MFTKLNDMRTPIDWYNGLRCVHGRIPDLLRGLVIRTSGKRYSQLVQGQSPPGGSWDELPHYVIFRKLHYSDVGLLWQKAKQLNILSTYTRFCTVLCSNVRSEGEGVRPKPANPWIRHWCRVLQLVHYYTPLSRIIVVPNVQPIRHGAVYQLHIRYDRAAWSPMLGPHGGVSYQ